MSLHTMLMTRSCTIQVGIMSSVCCSFHLRHAGAGWGLPLEHGAHQILLFTDCPGLLT